MDVRIVEPYLAIAAVPRDHALGLSRFVAMGLSGHKTEAVYGRYAITNEADLAEGVRKVP